MKKYREVLESLKETLKMVANREDVIKESVNLNSSSTDFAGYLYHQFEEEIKESNLLDTEIDNNPENPFNKKINLLSSYVSTVVAEDENQRVSKKEVKPFHVRSYRNSKLLKDISEADFGDDNIENLIKSAKTNTHSLGKNFSLDFDTFGDSNSHTVQKINFAETNSVLSAFWDKSQIQKMGNILSENMSSQANNVREGACGVIYALFAEKGYKITDIISGKVSEQDAKNVYDRIIEIGQLSDSLKSKEITDEEKKTNTEKLNSLNEKLLDDFLLGARNMCEEYDKSTKYEDHKDVEKETSIYNESTRTEATLLTIIGTNYFQDRKFAKNVEESYKRRPLLMDGVKFDLHQATEYLSDRTSGAARLLNLYDKEKGLKEIETATSSNSGLFEKYIGLQTELNTNFYDDLSRMQTTSLYNNILEENESYSDLIEDSVDWTLYMKKTFKEGKLFNDITVDPITHTAKTSFSIDDVKKGHKEYLKNGFIKDIESNLDRTLEKDEKSHELTGEEISKSKELYDRHQAYCAWLDKRFEEKVRVITENVDKYKEIPDEKVTFSLSSDTSQLAAYMENYGKEELPPAQKYSLLVNEHIINSFTKGEYKESKNKISEIELDRFKINYSSLTEIPRDFKYNRSLSPNQEKIFAELEEQYKSAPNKESFLQNTINTANEIAQSSLYKKATAPSVATNTKTVIKQSYETFLNELKSTSELDSKGEPAGNSTLFMSMYNSIKDISEMSPNAPDFNEKYKKSQECINAYINKRDGFIKIHSYGRERLRIAKQMQGLNEKYIDCLEKCDERIKEEKKKVNGVLFRDEKENLVEKGTQVGQTKVTDLSKNKNLNMEVTK